MYDRGLIQLIAQSISPGSTQKFTTHHKLWAGKGPSGRGRGFPNSDGGCLATGARGATTDIRL